MSKDEVNDQNCRMKEKTNQKAFACNREGCQKSYALKQHLVRHIRVVHLGRVLSNESIVCHKCQDTFASKQNLEKHIRRKHGDFPHICHVCSQGFSRETLLAHHLYLHTGEKLLKCKYCDRMFANQTERYRHQGKHKTFECTICNEKFKQHSEFSLHKKESHQFQFGEYHCDICGKIFKCKPYIVRHMKTHIFEDEREVFYCTMCPKYYTFKFNLKHHIRSVHENKTYDCDVPDCGAKLSTKVKLQQHIKRHKIPTSMATSLSPKLRNVRKDRGTAKNISALRLAGIISHFENDGILIDA